jgi:hypothetical protein
MQGSDFSDAVGRRARVLLEHSFYGDGALCRDGRDWLDGLADV